jgi:endonuclease YncB( thermonuclease family)
MRTTWTANAYLAAACLALLAVPVGASPAGAGERPLAGPVQARVVSVLDGDTFLADALVWPGQTIRVNVRIRGIDAPEMKSRCPVEHAAALAARDALSRLIGGGSVSISNIAGAKYYGRVLADVVTGTGADVAPALLSAAVVRPYDGGHRAGWCG